MALGGLGGGWPKTAWSSGTRGLGEVAGPILCCIIHTHILIGPRLLGLYMREGERETERGRLVIWGSNEHRDKEFC